VDVKPIMSFIGDQNAGREDRMAEAWIRSERRGDGLRGALR